MQKRALEAELGSAALSLGVSKQSVAWKACACVCDGGWQL